MKKTIAVLILALLVMVGGVYYFMRSQGHSINWKIYTNTVYGYQVSYPQDTIPDDIIRHEPIPVEESDDVTITTKENLTKFGVTAYTPLTGWGTEIEKKQTELITLPLQQFAEAVRKIQVDDKNPYEQDKHAGELNEITFAGQKAYSFTLNRGFNGPHGSYTLDPDTAVYNLVFIENKAGVKLMIRYPLNDSIAERIANSFKVI